MKRWHLTERSYKKRSILLIIALLFNYFILAPYGVSFFGSVLAYWLQPAFWLGIAFLLCNWPMVKIQGKKRHQGFLRFWALNFAVLYILASIIGGLFNGFGRSPYSHSLSGILQNLIQAGAVLVGRELTRSYLVNSFTKRENYGCFTILAILMAVTNISLSRFINLHDYKEIMEFSAQYLIPELLINLLAVYFVYQGGPVPSLIYLGIIQAFQWLSPVLPDLKWITAALIGILCPVFSFLSLRGVYLEESRDRRRANNKGENPISLLVCSLVSIAIVWFAVGIFPVYPSVVATGSMEPLINPGDVILVKKIKPEETMQTGEIIQFRRDDILISHRIVEIVQEEKSLGYRTKGDNNSGADSQIVQPEEVKGRVLRVIPKIGRLTIFIKSDRSH